MRRKDPISIHYLKSKIIIDPIFANVDPKLTILKL